jgi:flagellar basal body rod protein FlgG
MRVEADTLRLIAQNSANVETTAYRRSIPVLQVGFEEFLGGARGDDAPAVASLPTLKIAVDHSQTTLKSTGAPLDLALDSPGFFVLQGAKGQLLTRRGDFRVTSDGLLASKGGEPVLGQSGPIQIGSSMPSVATDGSISIDGVVVDRLRVAMPTDSNDLLAVGDGRFFVEPQQLVDQDAKASIRQGFLEASNVSPTNEMILMMETLRRFEMQQRFARAHDDMLSTAISELGKTD